MRERLQHGDRQPRLSFQQLFEMVPGDREAADLGGRAYPSRVRGPVVKEREFPEELPRAQVDLAISQFDGCRTLLDHEQSGARLFALNQDMTVLRYELCGPVEDPRQRSVI